MTPTGGQPQVFADRFQASILTNWRLESCARLVGAVTATGGQNATQPAECIICTSAYRPFQRTPSSPAPYHPSCYLVLSVLYYSSQPSSSLSSLPRLAPALVIRAEHFFLSPASPTSSSVPYPSPGLVIVILIAIMKGFWHLSLLPLLAAGSPVLVDTIHNDAAPIISSSNAKEIAHSYMVIFKKHVTERDAVAHHSWVQDVHISQESRKQELRKRSQTTLSDDTIFEGLRHTYNIPGGLLGYAGHFDEDVIELVRRHPDVSTPASLHFLLSR